MNRYGTVKMTAVIDGIVNGFKEFIAKLEKMGDDVVHEISAKAPALAQQILVLLKAAFNDIKARIASLIKAAKAKWTALSKKRMNTSLGQSASSFSSRLRAKAQEVERRAEAIIAELRSSATAMVEEAKNNLKRLSDGMRTAAGDVTADIRKAGEDAYRELLTIGHNAITRVKTFMESSFKDLEVDGSFAVKHSLQVGEAAAISSFNPAMIVSFGLSAAIVIFSHKYADKLNAEAVAAHQ